MAVSHIVQYCPEPAAVNSKQLSPGTKKLGTRNPENIKKEEKRKEKQGGNSENIKNKTSGISWYSENKIFLRTLADNHHLGNLTMPSGCLPKLGFGQREHNGVSQSPQEHQKGNEPQDSQERGMRSACGSSGSGQLYGIPHENDLGNELQEGLHISRNKLEGRRLQAWKTSPLNSSHSFLSHHSGVANLHYMLRH